MILFKRLWKQRQERPIPRGSEDSSWVVIAACLLIICLLWILWMRDWQNAGYPELPPHPGMRGQPCSE